MLAIGVCAMVGLAGGAGYAVLTPPPFTASAAILTPPAWPIVLLPYIPPPAAGPGIQVTQLTDNVLEITAQRDSAAQAKAAVGGTVRSYLARVPGAKLLDQVAIVPRRGGRLPALAVAGAVVGALAGALGALTARRREPGP